MKKFLLIDVDTQWDFIDPAGKLSIPSASDILKNIEVLGLFCADNGIPIISTVDAHDPDDPEFKTYPEHCVIGTKGQEKVEESLVYKPLVINHIGFPKNIRNFRQFIIEKKTYNVWDETLGNPVAMTKILDFFKPKNILLAGVATDICVHAAQKGLKKFIENCTWGKPEIFLIVDATKGLANEFKSKVEMGLDGVKMITTEELLDCASDSDRNNELKRR